MTRDELKAVIAAEGLGNALFLDESSIDENSVVLEPHDGRWLVYLTIERAAVVPTTVREFDTEAEALDHVLVKLRQSARGRELGGASGSAHG
jgi:hypothetical protein